MRHGPSPSSYLVRLCVVKRADADTWTYLRCTAVETIPTAGGIERFHTSTRIRKGQYISMILAAGEHPLIFHGTDARSVDVEFFPAPALGMPTMPDFRGTYTEFLWNATIRRPG